MSPYQWTIVFWVIVHCVVIAGFGCLAFLLPTGVEGGVLNQPVPPNSSGAELGAVFSGTMTGAFVSGPGARMRWVNLNWEAVDGGLFQFVCNYNVSVGLFDAQRVASSCLFVPINPPGVPPSPNNTGVFFYRGTFNLVYSGTFLSVLTGRPVTLSPSSFVAYNKTSVAIVQQNSRGRVSLFAYRDLRSPPPPLPNNTNVQAVDPRLLGVAFDVSQFLLYVSLFLIALPIGSALLSHKRRTMLALNIILMCCIFANVLMVVLQQVPTTSVSCATATRVHVC